MTALPFWHIDAFADGPFTGNPAGVVALDRWRDDAELTRIAAEIALPATAFVVTPKAPANPEIRWFFPDAEIVLCGHGTLAAGHALMADREEIRFETRRAGIVGVMRDGDAYRLSFPLIPVVSTPLPASVAAMGGEPVETLWNDGGYALIRYADAAAVRTLTPDLAALKAIGPVQHIATAAGDDSDIISRVFSAAGSEDAATGSAHAVLTSYWADRLDRSSFTAFQASPRGARIGCRLTGDRAWLTGRCVTIVEGRFLA